MTDAGERLADLAERTAGWLDRSLIQRDGYEPTIAQLADSLRRGAVGYRAALAASPSEEALRMLQEAWDILNGASIYLGHRERLSAEISAYLAALLRTTREGEG